MGCPHIYYTRALQTFAYGLTSMDDPKLAKELYEETSNEKLEAYILQKKEQMSEKAFYYDAGRACQCVLEEAYEDGCDPLNASVAGLTMFDDFIGLEEGGNK